jgi:hypothetical protein
MKTVVDLLSGQLDHHRWIGLHRGEGFVYSYSIRSNAPYYMPDAKVLFIVICRSQYQCHNKYVQGPFHHVRDDNRCILQGLGRQYAENDCICYILVSSAGRIPRILMQYQVLASATQAYRLSLYQHPPPKVSRPSVYRHRFGNLEGGQVFHPLAYRG